MVFDFIFLLRDNAHTLLDVSQWYVYPQTHITSDTCIPGRDTQNTEALYPGLQMIQGKHGSYKGQILWVYILKFQPIQNINGRRSDYYNQ